jgi:DNA replication protein DnaC
MSPTISTTTVTPTRRRRRGLTEQATVTAVDPACHRLHLPTFRAGLDEALTVAGKEQLSYQGFLAELLLAECNDRDHCSSNRRVKAANFPRDKWLGDFGFDADPNINAATIHTLATGDWIRKGRPLCLIGDSGTGKSHLLIGLVWRPRRRATG